MQPDQPTPNEPKRITGPGPRYGFGVTKGGKTKKGKVDQRTTNKKRRSGADVAALKDERIIHLMNMLSLGQYIPHSTPRELAKEWGYATHATVEHMASDAARTLRMVNLRTEMIVGTTLSMMGSIAALAISDGDLKTALAALIAKQGMSERYIALGWDKDIVEGSAEEKEDEREITLRAILPHRLAAEANERGDAPVTVEAPDAAPVPPVTTTPEKQGP